jgi:Tol biopolymer transport system component
MPGPLANLTAIAVSAFLTLEGAQPQEASVAAARQESVARLAAAVRGQGWIIFGARSDKGDWDLFACRPDGTAMRNITRTPGFNEAAPQVSRDGRKLLYRRMPREEPISGNQYGTQGELVIADADGAHPAVVGESGAYPWASWSPDGRQLACLSIKGIVFVDVATRRVVRTLPRKGFFQQMTWSPDGKSLAGVANAFGTSWSVGRVVVATGEAIAVSRVDCCTPDWFPDSRHLIFSNRPRGQRANHGAGWTQLWMADLEGKSRRLVYAEDGRHVYGGCISPDGRFALFTGNMEEDGDPGHAGAPMGLMRLSDAPIIVGESKELRKLYPDAKRGPVLDLPPGWEPCWSLAEIPPVPVPSPAQASAGKLSTETSREPSPAEPVAVLAGEVRNRGWIAASAPSNEGVWDLVLLRPDGSERRSLTRSDDYHEAGVRFSPDGKKLLYYRNPRSEALDNNTYGTYELVVAHSDGSHAISYGQSLPWATWGPDSTQLACLDKSGILIIDVESRHVLRKLPRKGIVQQLAWSPDGQFFAGTANGLGPYWNIARLDAEAARINAVSDTDRYNCTPDWMPDSRGILYSRGIIPEAGGWAQLWLGTSDGSARRMLYGEDKRHVYGGCASPDAKYLLFTRSELDLGPLKNSRTTMALIRMTDTPMVGGMGAKARPDDPSVRRGPMLDLSWGWEPHWTYAELSLPKP